MKLFIVISILFNVAFSIDLSDTKLEHVQIIFRHGERSPIERLPFDTFKDSSWDKFGGYGQLTQTGIKTSHNFGTFLREFYSDFIPESYNRNFVYVRSTDYDRTIMSAQSLLSGLFPPENEQVWNKNIRWQPVPVHMTHKNEDELYNLQACPRFTKLKNDVFESNEAMKLIDDNQDLIDRVNKGIGNGNLTLIDFKRLSDNLFISKENKLSQPDWVTSNMYRQIRLIGTGLSDLYYKTIEMAKLTSGSILFKIKQNIIEKTENKSTNQLYLFSAHDSYVSALSKLLDTKIEMRQPNYCSAIVIELRRANNDFYVRALWKNNPSSAGIDMKEVRMFGQGKLIPLKKFMSLIEDRVVENNKNECKLETKRGSLLVEYALIITCILIGLFFSLTGLAVYKLNKLRSRRHFVMDLGENVNLMISDDEIYSNTDQVVFNKETVQ